MNPTTTLDPTDPLADALVESSRLVAQQMCRFLIRLREFDLHQGYAEPSKGGRIVANCAEWLNANCGIERDTAREMLRVAYSLLNLPCIEMAFESGDLSYAKACALTTVATTANEQSLLDFARVMTDAQVENYCRCLTDRALNPGNRKHRSIAATPGRGYTCDESEPSQKPAANGVN